MSTCLSDNESYSRNVPTRPGPSQILPCGNGKARRRPSANRQQGNSAKFVAWAVTARYTLAVSR